jgi:hypothetical protein
MTLEVSENGGTPAVGCRPCDTGVFWGAQRQRARLGAIEPTKSRSSAVRRTADFPQTPGTQKPACRGTAIADHRPRRFHRGALSCLGRVLRPFHEAFQPPIGGSPRQPPADSQLAAPRLRLARRSGSVDWGQPVILLRGDPARASGRAPGAKDDHPAQGAGAVV